MEIENLNLLQSLQGGMVEINRKTKSGYIQEFSNELSILETSKEVILDNLYILNEDEVETKQQSIHIFKERILEVEKNFSDDLEILTTDGLITIGKM